MKEARSARTFLKVMVKSVVPNLPAFSTVMQSSHGGVDPKRSPRSGAAPQRVMMENSIENSIGEGAACVEGLCAIVPITCERRMHLNMRGVW